jgi:hypothetical protein
LRARTGGSSAEKPPANGIPSRWNCARAIRRTPASPHSGGRSHSTASAPERCSPRPRRTPRPMAGSRQRSRC